ncbi:ParB/RepB/Spo0J family partition protein [Vibrio vulnificus]
MVSTKKNSLSPSALLAKIHSGAASNTRHENGEDKIFKQANIPMANIHPDPNQPRKDFDPDALQELADSINDWGLLQDIIVRKDPTQSGYIIVVGERRWRAANLLKWNTISCKVMPALPEKLGLEDAAIMQLVQLTENIVRTEMTGFEEAASFSLLQKEYGMSLADVANLVQRSKTYVYEAVKIYESPLIIKKLFKDKVVKKALLKLIKLMATDKALVEQRINARIAVGSITMAWVESLEAEMLSDPNHPEMDGMANGHAEDEDSKEVGAEDSADVGAEDSADVGAADSADVGAEDSADVGAEDSADVGAADSAEVGAEDSADVGTADSAAVGAEDNSDKVSYDDLAGASFIKRPASKARITVQTPSGTGVIKLEYAPHEPVHICVELDASGRIVTVPFESCQIVSYE